MYIYDGLGAFFPHLVTTPSSACRTPFYLRSLRRTSGGNNPAVLTAPKTALFYSKCHLTTPARVFPRFESWNDARQVESDSSSLYHCATSPAPGSPLYTDCAVRVVAFPEAIAEAASSPRSAVQVTKHARQPKTKRSSTGYTDVVWL